MRYIDTHTHYDDEVYNDTLDKYLNESLNKNVDKIINVSCDLKSSISSIKLSKKYEYMYCSIGFHPSDAISYDEDELIKLLNNDKIVAIGEIGLDYHYENTNKDLQKKVFINQINLAKRFNLPIIVHSRDASLDTYNIIKEHAKDLRVLFHCFAPTDDLVRLVIENEYYVAFGGNITYKRNESFKKYINMIPVNQIVIETDLPYLSPEPYRGKINSSANLHIICNKLSEYIEMNEEKLAEILYENSIKFFSI